ncbi:hypothetical protein D3C85_1633480 [compost metagenome]
MQLFVFVLQVASEQFGIQRIGLRTNFHAFAVMAQLIAIHHVDRAAGLMGQIGKL